MAAPTQQLNPTEQDALVKQIGLALLRAAPADWASIEVAFRALGRYTEIRGQVSFTDERTAELPVAPEVVGLFARLRAGMYRDGRGTWFNARYQLDRPAAYNLEYDRDEPRWQNPPPHPAFVDELRMFPREEENVPDWLSRRLTAMQPPFRTARIFDGMGPAGPVLSRPPLEDAEREQLQHYLDTAPLALPTRGYDTDHLDDERRQTVPVAFHTDGVWIWPAAVNFYLRTHGVPPDPELVAHVRRAEFRMPEVDDQARTAAASFIAGPRRPPLRPPDMAQPEQPAAGEPVAPTFDHPERVPVPGAEEPRAAEPDRDDHAEQDFDEPRHAEAEHAHGEPGIEEHTSDEPSPAHDDPDLVESAHAYGASRHADQEHDEPRHAGPDQEPQHAYAAHAYDEQQAEEEHAEAEHPHDGQHTSSDHHEAEHSLDEHAAAEHTYDDEHAVAEQAFAERFAADEPNVPDPVTVDEPLPQAADAPADVVARLRARLAEVGVAESEYTVGAPADPKWTMEQTGEGWRVGWFDGHYVAPAVFADAADAAAFLAGKVLLEPAPARDAGPPTTRASLAELEDDDDDTFDQRPRMPLPPRPVQSGPSGDDLFRPVRPVEGGLFQPHQFDDEEEEYRPGLFAQYASRRDDTPVEPTDPGTDHAADHGTEHSADPHAPQPANHHAPGADHAGAGHHSPGADQAGDPGESPADADAPALFTHPEPSRHAEPDQFAGQEQASAHADVASAQPVNSFHQPAPNPADTPALYTHAGPDPFGGREPGPFRPPADSPRPGAFVGRPDAPDRRTDQIPQQGGEPQHRSEPQAGLRKPQDWPIQPLAGEPPLTLFRGKQLIHLAEGTELDRYGDASGNLTYAVGTPFDRRSLVPDWINRPYRAYRVVRATEALTGAAIPWFDQPGGGTAFVLPQSVAELVNAGVLEEMPDRRPPARA